MPEQIEKDIDRVSIKYKIIHNAHFSKIIKDVTYKHDIDANLSSTMKKTISKKALSKFLFGILASMVVVNLGNPQYSSFVVIILKVQILHYLNYSAMLAL